MITRVNEKVPRKRSPMSVQEHFSAFVRDVAMILEEYQIQCQAMAIEASTPTNLPLFPTFSLQRPKANPPEASKKFASSPVYPAEELAQHSAEWFDEQLVALASRTKRPFGQDFRKKMRHVFPSIPGHDMVNHINRLVAAGRIKNTDSAQPQSRAGDASEEKEVDPPE
jgi:hypothetical protein